VQYSKDQLESPHSHNIYVISKWYIPKCIRHSWIWINPKTPFQPVADPGGANPVMASHQSCQWSLAPLWGRKSNNGIVNLSKCKAPPMKKYPH